MLIRNVDSTWKYKKVAAHKILKGKAVKKIIDKASDEERTRDLIYYFVARRITPLMYRARTSVVSLQRKVRTTLPIGVVYVKVKELTGFQPKSVGSCVTYINGKSIYQNSAGIVRDKKTKSRTTPKKGVTNFVWNEQLTFDVKDVEMQGLEFHLWEKKFMPNSGLGWFTILLRDVIPSEKEECRTEHKADLVDGTGQVSMDIHYIPNKEEIERLEREREKEREKMRSTASEFDFLNY